MKILAVALFLVSIATAQTTWQSLKFGMSTKEITETLRAKGFLVTDLGKGRLDVSPAFEVKDPGVSMSFWFKVQLSGDAKGLHAVTLSIDPEKTARAVEDGGAVSMAVVARISTRTLYKQLIGKYGVPMEKKGPCEEVSTDAVLFGTPECDAKWRSDGQIVSLSWAYFSRPHAKLFLSIQYEDIRDSGL